MVIALMGIKVKTALGQEKEAKKVLRRMRIQMAKEIGSQEFRKVLKVLAKVRDVTWRKEMKKQERKIGQLRAKVRECSGHKMCSKLEELSKSKIGEKLGESSLRRVECGES